MIFGKCRYLIFRSSLSICEIVIKFIFINIHLIFVDDLHIWQLELESSEVRCEFVIKLNFIDIHSIFVDDLHTMPATVT